MKQFIVSVEYRLPTTNDVNDGFGDFPNHEFKDYTVNAETERKAINLVSKITNKKLSTIGVGANVMVKTI